MIDTLRLRLRCWRETDRNSFAAMHAEPEAMVDYGRLLSGSDAKLDRYAADFLSFGLCRWAVEDRVGDFLGYVGIGVRQIGHGGGAPGMNGDLMIHPASGYVVAALSNFDPPQASSMAGFVGLRLPSAGQLWGQQQHLTPAQHARSLNDCL